MLASASSAASIPASHIASTPALELSAPGEGLHGLDIRALQHGYSDSDEHSGREQRNELDCHCPETADGQRPGVPLPNLWGIRNGTIGLAPSAVQQPIHCHQRQRGLNTNCAETRAASSTRAAPRTCVHVSSRCVFIIIMAFSISVRGRLSTPVHGVP